MSNLGSWWSGSFDSLLLSVLVSGWLRGTSFSTLKKCATVLGREDTGLRRSNALPHYLWCRTSPVISVLIYITDLEKKLQQIKAALKQILILVAFKREDGILANKSKSVESSSWSIVVNQHVFVIKHCVTSMWNRREPFFGSFFC